MEQEASKATEEKPLSEVDLHGGLIIGGTPRRGRIRERHCNWRKWTRLPIPFLPEFGEWPEALRQIEWLNPHIGLVVRPNRMSWRSARFPLSLLQFQSEKWNTRIAVNRDTTATHSATNHAAVTWAGQPKHQQHPSAPAWANHLHGNPSLAMTGLCS